MIIQSSVLGAVEIETDKAVKFTQGMPGFEDTTSFVLLQPDPSLPFTYMQSLDRSEVVFLLTDPFVFAPEYDLRLSEDAVEELQIQGEQDVQVWSVVTLKDSIETATMNLLAPVIINVREKLGRQIVLTNSTYSTRQLLSPPVPHGETKSTGDGA
ncbi:flagellar assembly protein FliW [Cohnella hashimotonis]|uniref:Flagellar assembly factor FliW n=1 Tax=Cohnella hashimotonis TaxID=2826895 RepID=A0ABT6TU13_9BACL|nr:flagellar assembly protein FliW [Cohnella hashimotonis]MDI4650351.1 flagellar assembly protein FliW [Cohnella hashimotonis]